MVSFQKTEKILSENIRFAKISESKREFFSKHHQVNIFLIRTYFGLDLQIQGLLTNLILGVNRLPKGNGQNQVKEPFVLEVKVIAFLASFFFV